MQGTFKIDGAVETVKGDAEKGRLLKNARAYVNLGNYNKAKSLYNTITTEYPDDYNGWWEFVLIILQEIKENQIIKFKSDGFEVRFDLLELYNNAIKVCKDTKAKESMVTQWIDYWKTIATGINDGLYTISNLITFCPDDNAFNVFPKVSESMKHIIDVGYSNAKKLAENNVRYGYLHTDSKTKGFLPYDKTLSNNISFAIGRQLLWNDINTPYDEDTCGVELFEKPLRFDQAHIEQVVKKAKENKTILIRNGFCPLCGFYPIATKMFSIKECRNCKSRF